jgi:hypothetical protein
VSAARANGDPRFVRLALRGGEAPVALLVTVGRQSAELVVPLRVGKNFIGRDPHATSGPWPSPPAVEQAQWIVACEEHEAQVWDAASTNLSALVPASIASTMNLGDGPGGFEAVFRAPEVIALPHPNVRSERHRYPLREGDVLRSFYAAFVFGWLEERA